LIKLIGGSLSKISQSVKIRQNLKSFDFCACNLKKVLAKIHNEAVNKWVNFPNSKKYLIKFIFSPFRNFHRTLIVQFFIDCYEKCQKQSAEYFCGIWQGLAGWLSNSRLQWSEQVAQISIADVKAVLSVHERWKKIHSTCHFMSMRPGIFLRTPKLCFSMEFCSLVHCRQCRGHKTTQLRVKWIKI
jgi:hypothetical protein